MIQSPRGYFMRRQDNATSSGGRPLSASLWADEVGNDIAHALDIRHQPIANWTARKNGSGRQAGDNQFGANAEGLTYNWLAETIGPFPLHRLVTGQPSPLRVVVDLKSSDGEEVFCRATLRHAHEDPAPTVAHSALIRNGWNHGFASTDATSYAALPVNSLGGGYDMRGFLQFPPGRWLADTPVQHSGDSVSRCCMACVDLWLGRMSDTSIVTLGGYTIYAVAYGARAV